MEQLIKKCKKYDREAQRKMVDYLMPFLTAICKRYGNCDYGYTKDLVQESLVKILNNIEKCNAKNDISFKAWSKTVTINTCLQKLRKQHIVTQELNVEYVNYTAAATALNNLKANDILKLLDHLPEQHRVIFNLAIIDGYKHSEIAEKLNISESSSRVFLSRARSTMQKLVTKDRDFIYKTRSI